MLPLTFAIAISLALMMSAGAAAALPGAAVSPRTAMPDGLIIQAQQGPGGGAKPRGLGLGAAGAVRAAQRCAGGQAIKVDAGGGGYNVRMLVGNQVVVVRVDRNGNCR